MKSGVNLFLSKLGVNLFVQIPKNGIDERRKKQNYTCTNVPEKLLQINKSLIVKKFRPFDWMFQVMWSVLTNQRALFQSVVVKNMAKPGLLLFCLYSSISQCKDKNSKIWGINEKSVDDLVGIQTRWRQDSRHR